MNAIQSTVKNTIQMPIQSVLNLPSHLRDLRCLRIVWISRGWHHCVSRTVSIVARIAARIAAPNFQLFSLRFCSQGTNVPASDVPIAWNDGSRKGETWYTKIPLAPSSSMHRNTRRNRRTSWRAVIVYSYKSSLWLSALGFWTLHRPQMFLSQER